MNENKLLYITSPYAGDVEKNVAFAKAACQYAMEQGCTPVTVHLLYPLLLDDSNPAEREAGIRMGLRVLEACDELWLCGSLISYGMQEKLSAAEWPGIPVRRISSQEIESCIGEFEREALAVTSSPVLGMAGC